MTTGEKSAGLNIVGPRSLTAKDQKFRGPEEIYKN